MTVDHLVIANFSSGYKTNRKPFLIDNDAFPVLNNAYEYRGQIVRKRGTTLLGRLKVDLASQVLGNTDGGGAFSGNIFTILGIDVFASNASIVLESIEITVGAQIFVEASPPDGTLTNGGAGTGTIDYQTGDLTLQTDPVLAVTAVTITFSYYPAQPVLGFEDFDIGTINQSIPIAFDTLFSYGFNQGTNEFYNVNFYKSTIESFQWQGANYQQFFSTNYMGITTINDLSVNSGCLWATNGNPGFHFITITNVVIAGADTAAAVATITTSAAHNLTNNDFVFVNEVGGIIATASPPRPFLTFGGINGASAQVTVTGANTFTIPVPWTTVGPYTSGGIVQYMTRATDPTGDGIRWYDGDPTPGGSTFGWVNFAPPLSQYVEPTATDPGNPFPLYLVGAKMVIPFKNRLVFFGVTLRNSQNSPGNQFYANRLVYSQVGTPYYSLPLPANLSTNIPDPEAWFQNVAGKGGFITAPIDEQVVTADVNEDIIICGFETHPLKLLSTGDDILPFIFQTISSELGAESTYASVPLDVGSLYIGEYGIAMVTSTSAQRIDLDIPDQVFEIANNGNQPDRITAIRDFQREVIYFTFPEGQFSQTIGGKKIFPSKTFLYNYRELTWASADDNYTRYGTFRRSTNRTWANIGQIYPTWSDWTDPWDFGANQAFFPTIVGGNQHGFVLEIGRGIKQATSQYIQAVSGITITSPDHCLNSGDYIRITGMIGSTNLNDTIQQINVIDTDTFTVNDPAIGTYLGGGIYTRLARPFIQTKQFPIYWKDGRSVRVGTQRFLFETNSVSEDPAISPPQVTVNVYSSQNADDPSNEPSANSYLSFSNVVLTCPEPGNLYSGGQSQIWHRLSNSFNGDSIQLGFTLSDAQMRDENVNEEEIILHAIVLDLYPGPVLL